MSRFSQKIVSFLDQVGADQYNQVAIVSPGSCHPGDILFFRYKLGTGLGSRGARLVLLVRPVFRNAKTGNKLMTCFTLPMEQDYSRASLEILYKLGRVKNDQGLFQYSHMEIDTNIPLEDRYRTYIVGNIYGPLRKISRIEEEKG